METLIAQPIFEQSQIDLNKIANTILSQVSQRITENVVSEVKTLLENHFPKQPQKTEFYTQKEAYTRLGLSRSAFYQREKSGHIVRDGHNGKPLYSVEQIENYLRNTGNELTLNII